MYACMLVSPDGDYVITYEAETVSEVVDKVMDRGSKWFFYPYEFIVKYPFNPNGYVVDHPYYNFKKRKIKISRLLQTFKDVYASMRENGDITVDDYIDMILEKLA